jgi:antiviral helicase SKI2
MAQYVKILTGECKYDMTNSPIKFNFETDNFQNHSFSCISRDENVLVTAHTGSGKTVIAEYAIAHYINKNKRVVYTSPIKALSNQKYKELREKFSSVGLMTGDNKINNNADLVIMTTEILRNSLYDYGKMHDVRKDIYFDDDFIDSVGCVIFDEVHYINDKDRGHVWEETLILLKPHVTLVMLSATIDKPELFCEWIANNKQKIINLIPTTKRMVPLEHYIYCGDNIHKIIDSNNKFHYDTYNNALNMYKKEQLIKKNGTNIKLIGDIIRYLIDNNLIQTIFFSFSRKNCEKYAQSINFSLLDYLELAQVNSIIKKCTYEHKDNLIKLEQYNSIIELAQKGVAFHHSGLLPILKELVEILFQKSLVKILFATETFSVGINMPTRSVVFTELEKPTNEGHRILLPSEYKQMSGRAGRRGIDTSGYVILLPLYNFPKQDELKLMVYGKLPHINSKFQINYSFILKIIQFVDGIKDVNVIEQFLNNTMFKSDLINNVLSYKKELCIIEKDIDKLNFNNNITQNIKPYLEFNKMELGLKDMGIILNKSQQKQKQAIMKKVNKQHIDIYNKYNTLIGKKINITNNINILEHDVCNKMNVYIHFLNIMGYIKCDDNTMFNNINVSNVTIKGIIASQINECNPLILTEIIYKNILDELNVNEICGLLAIFLDNDHNNDELINISSTIVTENISIIRNIINLYECKERELGIDNYLYDYYKINCTYIDMVYNWASLMSYQDAICNIDIYEGNFIKLIIKLDNIINDLIKLNGIYGNIKIIPKLESIHDIIIRDIVSIKSLYL